MQVETQRLARPSLCKQCLLCVCVCVCECVRADVSGVLRLGRRPYTDDDTADPSAAFVGAITREKHSSAAQQAAAKSPGNDRPVLIDQATVSSFQKISS